MFTSTHSFHQTALIKRKDKIVALPAVMTSFFGELSLHEIIDNILTKFFEFSFAANPRSAFSDCFTSSALRVCLFFILDLVSLGFGLHTDASVTRPLLSSLAPMR